MSDKIIKTDEEAPVADANDALEVPDAPAPDAPAAEGIRNGSMGGHDPDARKGNMENLVKSFGKWAKGKQSVCVRVLTTRHPELCAGRPGGCNTLCAWLKDQFLGRTTWRTGNKKNLVKEGDSVLEFTGPITGFYSHEGESWELPFDVTLDLLALEADKAKKGAKAVEKPEWFTEAEAKKLVEILEKDLKEGETTEADISYSEITEKLAELIRVANKSNGEEDNGGYSYCYVKDVYPGWLVYVKEFSRNNVRERELYKQQYTVSSDKVSLVGDPSKVVQTYVAAESDVDEPVSSPIIDWFLQEKQNAPKVWSSAANPTDSSATQQGFIMNNPGGDLKPVPEGSEFKESQFVVVQQDGDSFAVEMNSTTGEIISGPSFLVGQVLPPMPDNGSIVGESGILLEEHECAVFEMVDGDNAAIAEASAVGEKIVTPSNKAVDAIVKVIVPGPGNKRDRFYYTPEAIKQTVKVFEGRKMYKDHLTPDEDRKRGGAPRSFDDWVATVKEVWVGEDGTAYGGIKFVDDKFKQKCQLGAEDLGVSVRGRVKARPGKVNGEQYNIVEGFTFGYSVDFVTEAGAGGGIVSIAESNYTEGEMTPEELKQFVEANPEAFALYAKTLESKSQESAATVVDADAIKSIVAEAVATEREAIKKEVLTEVTEGFKKRDVANNRLLAKQMLEGTKLPKATQARLLRDFHDVNFESVEATDESPAMTEMEVFKVKFAEAIEEAQKEVNEATEGLTTVNDGGPGEFAVTEAGLAPKAVARPTNVNSRMSQTLGISILGTKKKDEPATAEASA